MKWPALDIFELSANIWFSITAVLVIMAALAVFRGMSCIIRGYLFSMLAYFLLRVWIEEKAGRELASVPIRIDLAILAPLDLIFCTGILIVIICNLKGLKL